MPLVALVILVIAITPVQSFASRPVLQLFLTYATEIALMTTEMSILLIVCEMDLSIGSIYVFSSVVFTWLNLVYGAPLWAAAIAAGFLTGVVNGLLVAYSGVSSPNAGRKKRNLKAPAGRETDYDDIRRDSSTAVAVEAMIDMDAQLDRV